MNAPSRSSLARAVIGALLVTAYAAWGALQILVLNPLAAVPGESVGQIHADMTSAQQWAGPTRVYAILGLGVLLAFTVLLVVLSTGMSATAITVAYLTLLTLGAPGYFLASFDSGMARADTYDIGGGDHSPWALPLYAVSIAALAAGIIMAATAGSRQPRAPRPAVA